MNLKRKICITTTSKRLNSACFQMLILRDTVDFKTGTMIYLVTVYFHSILQCSIEFWVFASGKETLLLFKKRSYESFPSCKPSYVLRTLNNDRAKSSNFQIIINGTG